MDIILNFGGVRSFLRALFFCAVLKGVFYHESV